MTDGHASDTLTLHDYVRVLRTRKWVVLLALLVVPATAVALTLQERKVYSSSADVLLSRQDVANSLTNTVNTIGSVDPERLAKTQADLAQTPLVARVALTKAGLQTRDPLDFLAQSSVSAKTGEDILVFSVSDHNPALARRLATAYGAAYVERRSELDTLALRRARNEVELRVKQLERTGQQGSALYNDLVAKDQQLRTLEALQTSNAYLVRTAPPAHKVKPKPVRNGLLGLVLGLLLGVALAFLWERLDTRIRSSDEIDAALGVPLLGRVMEPSRPVRTKEELVSIVDPDSVAAEAFRILATNVEFANLDHGAGSIMVTSAVEREGKTTTAANLAVAMARAGKRVVLVDLDVRRPSIAKYFGLEDAPGLTHVALGKLTLDEALRPIPLFGAANGSRPDHPLDDSWGSLHVLPAGLTPPNPSGFVNARAVSDALTTLTARSDVVIVDTSPLLDVGDAIALSGSVDTILVVARLKVLTRPQLREIRRVLQACPAPLLGFVATNAQAERPYGYSYRAYPYRTPERVDHTTSSR